MIIAHLLHITLQNVPVPQWLLFDSMISTWRHEEKINGVLTTTVGIDLVGYNELWKPRYKAQKKSQKIKSPRLDLMIETLMSNREK